MSKIEQIGDCTLYLADCMDVLPTLGKVDAVVTDPPYGIKVAGTHAIKHEGNSYGKHRLGKRTPKDFGYSDWDNATPSQEIFDAMLSAPLHIVWGYNYFASKIGDSNGLLVWDKKKQNGWDSTFSDCEIAATNAINNVQCIRHLWCGALRESEKSSIDKQHPTQKPLIVMEWCISHLPDTAQTILDPFMGSGTTGVACVKMGRKFIGIEREPEYFEIACKRIREAYAQPDLFVEQPKQLKQESLL